MKKEISVNRLFKLLKCFTPLLLLILLAMNTVSADLDCGDVQPMSGDALDSVMEDDLICQLETHFSYLQQDEPDKYETSISMLPDLLKMEKDQWCTHCHAAKSGNP